MVYTVGILVGRYLMKMSVTQQKILEVGKREFLAKGFKDASLRKIVAEAGFTKEEVRKLAEELSVSVASRPSTPCLATRLPYGTEIKTEALEKIALGEEYLKKQGFSVVRIRLHGEICRIEIPKADFGAFLEKSQEITEALQKRGSL